MLDMSDKSYEDFLRIVMLLSCGMQNTKDDRNTATAILANEELWNRVFTKVDVKS